MKKKMIVLEPTNGEAPAGATSEFQGWGTSLAWFAHATGKNAALREKICQLLFSPKEGMGMNIVR